MSAVPAMIHPEDYEKYPYVAAGRTVTMEKRELRWMMEIISAVHRCHLAGILPEEITGPYLEYSAACGIGKMASDSKRGRPRKVPGDMQLRKNTIPKTKKLFAQMEEFESTIKKSNPSRKIYNGWRQLNCQADALRRELEKIWGVELR